LLTTLLSRAAAGLTVLIMLAVREQAGFDLRLRQLAAAGL
jgi:hypothetical protein